MLGITSTYGASLPAEKAESNRVHLQCVCDGLTVSLSFDRIISLNLRYVTELRAAEQPGKKGSQCRQPTMSPNIPGVQLRGT
jgi:hypothetical protein